MLYYLKIIPITIGIIAKLMQFTLETSGTESLVVSSNIFVGMTEAPLLIKPFLPNVTLSELHLIMTAGFATVSGTVLGCLC